jgi:D-alanyl-D-alanine carboxypeptidase/D-alanyl-D-alanine-endopeptidase (penicillin-binding protein 4)
MKFRVFAVFALVFALAPAFAAPPATKATPASTSRTPETSLQQTAEAMAAAYEKSGGVVGLSVVDLATGKTLIAVRAEEPRTPASNEKILTSATALENLGKDFAFTTTVYLAGRDLVVTGDGDPTLGDPVLAAANGGTIYDELDRWAAEARKAGITEVGEVIMAPQFMADGFRNPDWARKHYRTWYCAPVSALNFNNNCLDVKWAAGAKAILSPESRFFQVVNKAKPGSAHAWSLQPNADDSVITLSGTVSSTPGEPQSTAINDPPLLLGRVLADRLEKAGVKIKGQVSLAPTGTVDLAKAKKLAETRTPLGVAMARANKRSLNMTAECIFLRAGDGTWSGSARKMTETLTGKYGLPEASLTVRDGGGLSQSDRIAPGAMTQLLAGILKRDGAGLFLASLPVCGVDGTMEKRLADPAHQGRVLGKTGYIAGVSCLSGYVLDADKRPALAFSVMANKFTDLPRTKTLEDAFAMMLVDALDNAAAPAAPAKPTTSKN